MKSKLSSKQIALLGVLSAIEIVLSIISCVVKNVAVTLNLGLIPICIASCLFGPYGGAFMGMINGLVLLPFQDVLLGVNLIGTVILCIGKTTVAGFISGLVFKGIKNTKISSYISSGLVPIINTSLFLIGFLTIYKDFYREIASERSVKLMELFIVSIVGVNFIIELAINVILASTIYRIIEYSKRRKIYGN